MSKNKTDKKEIGLQKKAQKLLLGIDNINEELGKGGYHQSSFAVSLTAVRLVGNSFANFLDNVKDKEDPSKSVVTGNELMMLTQTFVKLDETIDYLTDIKRAIKSILETAEEFFSEEDKEAIDPLAVPADQL